MQRNESPRDQWVRFLDGFSRQHEGWIASVQVTGDGAKNKPEARDLPFQGVSADLKHGDDDTVEIMLGNPRSQVISHNLSGVKHIVDLKDDQGADSGLEVDSRDGKAVLQFRSPARPETIDDVTRARR